MSKTLCLCHWPSLDIKVMPSWSKYSERDCYKMKHIPAVGDGVFKLIGAEHSWRQRKWDGTRGDNLVWGKVIFSFIAKRERLAWNLISTSREVKELRGGSQRTSLATLKPKGGAFEEFRITRRGNKLRERERGSKQCEATLEEKLNH